MELKFNKQKERRKKMKNKPMMKCGHVANAVMADKKPACVICNCTSLSEQEIDLTDRKARCTYYGRTFTHKGRMVTCTSENKSSTSLPFFKHKPENQYDEYYCGCWGWD
jgi:hypothetical protein